MSAPTQVTVTYLAYSGATPAVMTTATVVIPMPSSLTALDSGQLASGQTGYNALDCLLAGIVKRGGVTFTDSNGVTDFIPLTQIVKIVGA
jgi:hypothetical protein